ncbi:very long chain fatty acid elongase AAEL008004 [Leptinotarsa decemlineata]|uniref:very long chain fatty acid elongase AAEL008004 n=1 Tax=Leptinotarsa decemlineata TaxID=7539 RepID=UPI000C254C43|nr:elongation of very long chain fatty acids protein AAEL008004 [Leptinotarsa decemlineata]
MTGVFNLMDGYNNFMEKYTDPRTKDWFLVGKPGHLIVILATYFYFCKKAGPMFMRHRKPWELKRTIQIYNLIQVLASLYLVSEGLQAGWGTDYNFTCQPVVPGEKGMRMATGVWFYFICKLTELLDTVFFILRKKMNQVTYLHVYHHTLMPVCAWIGVTFLPGGHGTLLGLINAFIHVIMYSYYFLSSLGPQYQKYLWWKKHLTAMQMIQFCIIFWHNFQVLFKECDYPKFINFLLVTQAGYFLYLFGCFYVNQYLKSKNEKKSALENKSSTRVQNGTMETTSSEEEKTRLTQMNNNNVISKNVKSL